MTDTLHRAIAQSGKIFGITCDTTQLVNEAIRRHDLGPTAAAALGRALTGAILLAGLLKDNQSIQLTFEGNGPLGKVIGEAGNDGWCRGYVSNPLAYVPLKDGKIDVASGIGHAGFLRVVKDIGLKEKYTGLVQLYTSEIGDDIAYYLTESEQTPSTIGLGVHLQPNGEVAAAGGFLIQTLPPADESIISSLERSIAQLAPVTTLIAQGETGPAILANLFGEIEHKQTGNTPLSFSCTCSKEKMESVLATLSRDDLTYLMEKDDDVEISCEFCSESYTFSNEVLNSYLNKQ